MLTIIVFLIVLGIIVLFHEFGHFITAKKSGMGVYEFGFGFPPRAVGFRFNKNHSKKIEIIWGNRELNNEDLEKGTVYSINWLPFGGFVRIKGEDGNDTSSDSFMMAKFWKKILVAGAGVIMNIVLAALLLSIGYMIGLPQSVDGLPATAKVENRHLEIVQVVQDTPAAAAGIKTGDTILKIDAIDNPTVSEMQEFVNTHRDEEISFVFKRGSEQFTEKIKPTVYKQTGKGGIGVGLSEVGTVKFAWYEAIWQGFVASWLYLKAIFVAFVALVASLFSGAAKEAAQSVSGPIGIAVMTGEVARLGFSYLLQFTALLSLNLAVLNILPLPALDGGRILFLILGKIFRWKNSIKYEQIAHSFGFIILMALVILVTFKDLIHFFR